MSDCTVCDNAGLLEGATCHDKDFRWHLLKTLCYITELLTDEENTLTPESVILDQFQRSAAQLQADYATYAPISLVDTTKKLTHVRVVNTADCDLEFSYDGGDTLAFTVLTGTTYVDDFNLTLPSLVSFVMRRVSGDSATTGRVLVEGRY